MRTLKNLYFFNSYLDIFKNNNIIFFCMLKPSSIKNLPKYRVNLLKNGFYLKVLKNNYLNLLLRNFKTIRPINGNFYIIYTKDFDSLTVDQLKFISKHIKDNFIIISFLFKGFLYFHDKFALLMKYKTKNDAFVNLVSNLKIFLTNNLLNTLKRVA